MIARLRTPEHWPITVKIMTLVALLVALTIFVSLAGIYGLNNMQKAVETTSRASEIMVSVNTATERVEHFITSRDVDSLNTARAFITNTLALLSTFKFTRPDDAMVLTTGLHQFSKAIDTLHMATEIMDTETINMTVSHDRLRAVAIEIEKNIEKSQAQLDDQTMASDAQQKRILETRQILQSIRNGERTATAALIQGLIKRKPEFFQKAIDANHALIPVLGMLHNSTESPDWQVYFNQLTTSITQSERTIQNMAVVSPALQQTLAGNSIQSLDNIYERVNQLDSLVRTREEKVVRTIDDLRTEAGLLQNAVIVSKQFTEHVTKLEAQTLIYRLTPTNAIADVIYDLLNQLMRYSRILPSADSTPGSASVLMVRDQISDYRTAFEHFRQASKKLHQANEQERMQATQTIALVAQFVHEQQAITAKNRNQGLLISIIASIVAIMIALFIARQTSRVVARPIISLSEVMRRLANGHLDDRLPELHRGDEIGDMTRAVIVFQENARKVRILEAEAEIERQHIFSQLENKVAERTEVLQRQTETLEAQAKELDLARIQAEAATRTKSAFLANMSHELRTPLNAILGYTELLLQGQDCNEQQKRGLNIISQSGKHLLTLINDLLDLSKIEAGKLELEPTPVYLTACIQTVADIMQVKAEQKNVELLLELSPQLPSSVLLDEKRLRQILLNLLGNAVKFTDAGHVRLRIQATPQSNNLVRLTFEIEDTGIGMEAGQLQIIFQPFEQVGDIKRRANGTGLGLAISRELVRQMGGDIQVSSEPGLGSKFRFELTLPIANSDISLYLPQHEIKGYTGQRQRILIVDDVEANRTLLAELLEALTFETIQATNGQECIEQAIAWQPNLILMDVVMPVLDGLEATQQIRCIPQLQNIPVIIISASATDEELARGREAGANGFVSKPIEQQKLLEQIGIQLKLQWVVNHIPNPPPAKEQYESEWVLPLTKVEELHHLALTGNMREVRRWAERLGEEDPRYLSFANKLSELARTYQSKAILTLVQHFQENAQFHSTEQ